jgi:hypothetical protein
VAVSRNYVVDTGTSAAGWIPLNTAAAGTEYGLMYGAAAANFNYSISAIRIAIQSGSSASYPTNGSITFRLRRTTGSNTGVFAGTATVSPTGPGTLLAQSANTWIYGTASSAGTGTIGTPTNVLWSQTIPYTAGANWAEWFTPGFEIDSGAGGTIALVYTFNNGTSSATFVTPEFVISE